jgi:hypothetical protein
MADAAAEEPVSTTAFRLRVLVDESLQLAKEGSRR